MATLAAMPEERWSAEEDVGLVDSCCRWGWSWTSREAGWTDECHMLCVTALLGWRRTE